MDYNQSKHKAHFGPVAPVHILQEMMSRDPRGIFGDYHLLLAHHTVEKPGEFRKLFQEHRRNRYAWNPMQIIMDNSLVECKFAVDFNMVKEATQIIQELLPDGSTIIPVLPDRMGDGLGTMQDTQEAYEKWDLQMPGNGLMLVTQGKDWQEFTTVVNHFFVEARERYPRITWVGVPRKLVEALGTRLEAVAYIKMVAPHVKIHLLGFSDDVWDDLVCARLKGVLGIDSAVPVRHPGIFTPTSITPPRDGTNWWTEGKLTEDAITNIANVRKWISL